MNTSKKKSEKTLIPLEIVELEDNSFHIITPAEINGTSGYLIIDTGASVTVIDQNLLPEDATQVNPIEMQSGSVIGQINDIQIVQAENFKIGAVMLPKIQVAVINLDYVNEMYEKHLKRKIIGLLGCDFCIKHRAVIDYENKALTCHIESEQLPEAH